MERQPTDWEKNLWKWCDWKRLNFQNLKTAYTIQWSKKANLLKKWTDDINRHFSKTDIHRYMTTAAAAKSLQSCPTLCDPITGILQERTLEWVAISFSNIWQRVYTNMLIIASYEMKSKTTISYHWTPVIMTIIEKYK